MVHLEDDRVGELRHTPGPPVEPGAENDDLRVGTGSDRLVDGDRPGHHADRRPADQLVGDPLARAREGAVVTDQGDEGPLGRVEQAQGDRVGELLRGIPAVGRSPTLAHEARCPARGPVRHLFIVPHRTGVGRRHLSRG